MTLIVGFGVVAALVTWVTKVADARGRSALAWAILALVFALLGLWLGVAVVGGVAGGRADDDLMLLAILAPVVLPTAAVYGVVFALKRLPIKTSSRASWPVHDLTGGAGAITGELELVPGGLRIQLASARVIPIGALRAAKLDGECVRIAWDAGDQAVELVLLPCGKPDTPAGREAQSRVIVRRVNRHIASGSAAALPAAKLLS